MRPSLPRCSVTIKQPFVPSTHPSPYSWMNPAVAGPSSGPLAGRNIAIKENISYTAAPTSCSSLILQDYHPPYNATCVSTLLSSGAHIVGQTKMDEFGMGSQTTHLPPNYTPVHNPSAPDVKSAPRSAGGSSGGSAAAVAEGSCWAALGTDTGGSVRLPASYCGVVGLKPSYGMISRYGVIAYADSMDCVGVLGRTVDTVKQVYDTLSHPDPNDMTCISSHLRSLVPTRHTSSIEGLRIGIPREISVHSPPLLIKHLESQGATFHPVSLPSLDMALPAYYVLASAEAASNLGRFGGGWFGSVWEKDTVVESGEQRRRRIRTAGFGNEVKKRILAGSYALTAEWVFPFPISFHLTIGCSAFNNSYLKALHLRRLLRTDFNNIFRIPHSLVNDDAYTPPSDGIDVLLHPTAIRTAPPLDERGKSEYLQDLLTVPASLAGLPALSVPAGKGEDGWPVGVSLVGQWGTEKMLFDIGRGVESWQGGA
ncbi:aspartyl-tRNA(Asn)/glutamyl-tRNA(Gln) amidotransferase subunit A, partial [Tremellales sp. Uapishka_1]